MNEDDVAREYERVKTNDLEELSKIEPLIVNDVLKVFKKGKKDNFVAVNHLSFGVQSKECFGLLGLNGAGKT